MGKEKPIQAWLFATILFLGSCFYTAWEEWNCSNDLFQAFGLIVLYFLAIITGIAAVYNSIKLYRSSKAGRYTLLTSLVGVMAILSAKAHNYYEEHRPYFLKASFFEDFNGLSLVLRDDSTYVYTNMGPLGSASKFEGRFSLHGDTILLDKKPDDPGLISNKLLIRANEDGKRTNFIYQLDDRDSIVRRGDRMPVLEDLRNGYLR